MPHPGSCHVCPLWPNAGQTPRGRTPTAAGLRSHRRRVIGHRHRHPSLDRQRCRVGSLLHRLATQMRVPHCHLRVAVVAMVTAMLGKVEQDQRVTAGSGRTGGN